MSENPPANEFARMLDAETQERLRIMNEAVAKAQAENRAFGLPEIDFRDGHVVYIMPDGTETTKMPEVLWKR